MSTAPSPPQNPAGPFEPQSRFDEAVRRQLIDGIRTAPAELRKAIAGLSDRQLDTRYRNWTVRQIVHHLADSHVHAYILFKWALAEENPTIKAYEEADWVSLEDSRQGAVEPALALLDGLHTKWEQLLSSMSEQQFARTFVQPADGGDRGPLDGPQLLPVARKAPHGADSLVARPERLVKTTAGMPAKMAGLSE